MNVKSSIFTNHNLPFYFVTLHFSGQFHKNISNNSNNDTELGPDFFSKWHVPVILPLELPPRRPLLDIELIEEIQKYRYAA